MATFVDTGGQTTGGVRLAVAQSRWALSGVPLELSITVPSGCGRTPEISGETRTTVNVVLLPIAVSP